MTVIEFYDKASVENVTAALMLKSERVVFVGYDGNEMAKSIEYYKRVFEKRGLFPELLYRSVNRNNLQSIVHLLSLLLEKYGDCQFDLTGGDDLYLVAVGIMMERHGNTLQCHRMGFMNDMLYDCDSHGKLYAAGAFDLTVEENICLYGGETVRDSSYLLDDAELACDVHAMWDICKRNSRLWNSHVSFLAQLCGDGDDGSESEDSLDVFFCRSDNRVRSRGTKYVFDDGIMTSLASIGVIGSLELGEDVAFRFKNHKVKHCLTVSGQILELELALRLREIRDGEGAPLYNDVRVGVVLDWSSADTARAMRTLNEIDVIAMRGAVPIFISCKNGSFGVDELYKLSTVAQRFGSTYARCVIASTDFDRVGNEHLRGRITEMNIRLLSDLDKKSSDELDRALRSL